MRITDWPEPVGSSRSFPRHFPHLSRLSASWQREASGDKQARCSRPVLGGEPSSGQDETGRQPSQP